MKSALLPLLPTLLACAIFGTPPLRGQDVAAIFVVKAAWYEQPTAADPKLYPAAAKPYDLTATVYLSNELLSDPEWYLWVNGVTVRTPSGRTEALEPNYDAGSYEFDDGAETQQALNSRYGAGNYRVTFSSLITGDSVSNVPLAPDDYPPAPKCANFNAAQQIDPTRDFVLRWVSFTGTGDREIWLNLLDEAMSEYWFSAGPLDGDDTSVTIPAGTLAAESGYWAWLTFTRYTHASPGTVPATYAGFDAFNAIPLVTVTGGAAPDPSNITAYRVLPSGDLELTATCTPGYPLTVQGTGALDATWSNLQTTTPTASPAVLVVPQASLGTPLFLRLFQE